MIRRHAIRGATLLALALPAVTEAQRPVIVIRGGKVFTLAGAPIENGVVVIRNGKIESVGANAQVPAGAKVIDASGLQVYPGLFAPMSDIGLTEVGSVPMTNDQSELGRFNPHLLSATAVHPASEHIPVARANGITHAISAPNVGAGGIGGQASLLHLDGWTVEEMLLQPSVGFMVRWPMVQTSSFDPVTFQPRERPYAEAKKDQEKAINGLHEWLEAARRYDHAVKGSPNGGLTTDLRLEALGKAIRGELPLLMSVDRARDIKDAIAFAEREKVRLIIVGGAEAWKVKEELATKKIPVILGPMTTMPAEDDGAYDEMFSQPAVLSQAGVRFALSTPFSASARRLPYEAGIAVAFGLPWEEAMKAITVYPAEIFGLKDKLGTIEPGKIANVIVTDGDPLEIKTQIKHLVVNGAESPIDNRHLRLYERYRGRPKSGDRATR